MAVGPLLPSPFSSGGGEGGERGAAFRGQLGTFNPLGNWARLIRWGAPFTPGLGVPMGLELGLSPCLWGGLRRYSLLGATALAT